MFVLPIELRIIYKSRYRLLYFSDVSITHFRTLVPYNINKTIKIYFYNPIYITIISKREKANETPHAQYRQRTIIDNFVQSMFQRIIMSLPSVKFSTVKLSANTNYENNESPAIDCDLCTKLMMLNFLNILIYNTIVGK